jgi:hypothetical protein
VGSGVGGRTSRPEPVEATMREHKNPPLDLTPVPEGTPLTFDVMAHALLGRLSTAALPHTCDANVILVYRDIETHGQNN